MRRVTTELVGDVSVDTIRTDNKFTGPSYRFEINCDVCAAITGRESARSIDTADWFADAVDIALAHTHIEVLVPSAVSA